MNEQQQTKPRKSSRINIILTLLFKSTKLFKVFKSAKFIMPAVSLMSMAIFAVVQSTAMGIALGIGFTLLLLIHEFGHIIALKRKGYPVKVPFFIPFVGAVIFAPKMDNRHTEAYVGYGGPFIGTLAAMLCAIPYLFTYDPFWIVLSSIGIIINLFNMIPLSPLDGGRITQAVHPGFKWVGIGLLFSTTLLMGEPGMLIIWIACIIDMHKIKLKRRLQLCIFVWFAMLILTLLGVGKNATVNWIDVILGALLFVFPAGVYLWEQHKGIKRDEPEWATDNRSNCHPKTRVFWLTAWVVLLAMQIWFLVIMIPLFPSSSVDALGQKTTTVQIGILNGKR